MSYINIFNSQGLKQLYETGQLNHLLLQFKKYINTENYLGGGGDASCFLYKNPTQVLKLCIKKIRYFENIRGMQLSGLDFKKQINNLGEFFLPINDILYEDQHVFIYTQNRCQLIKKDQISPRIILGVFQMVKYMLKNNLLVTDISPQNLGFYNGRLVVFDYHGLHPFKTPDGQIKYRKWWIRILRNLTRYLSYIFAPEKLAEYLELMENFDDSILAKFKHDKLLPKSYIELVQYITFNDTDVCLDTTFELLEKCIQTILKTFNFYPKQLNHKHCLCSLCVDYDDGIGNGNHDG